MKKVFYLLVLLTSFMTSWHVVAAEDVEISARGAIALDANTGKILYEKEADQSFGIGSISKIMTAYLVYEAIDAKKFSLTTKVTPSQELYQLSQEDLISGLEMTQENYTVQDLLKASLHASSTPATLALADKVAGNQEEFLKQINAKLAEWGIESRFVSVAGDDASYQASEEDGQDNKKKKKKASEKTENTLSAYELAIITNHLIKDHPALFDLTATSNNLFGETSYSTSNLMLEGMPRMRGPVDGLKTGSSAQDGQAFVATSNERGMRLITIVLGIENPDQDPYLRFTDTNRILTYITQTYRPSTLVKQGTSYKDKKSTIIDGREDQIIGLAQEDLVIVEKMGVQEETPIQFHTDKNGYQAPIKKDQAIGYLTFEDKDLVGHGYLEGKLPQIPVVAQKEVKKAFFPKIWWNHFVRYVNEKL